MDFELRNDVYRRPLVTALDRLGLREGWTCADVGAGGGDVTVALARVVGRDGRVYAVDSDPARRDEVAAAAAAAAQAQVVALTQAGEELTLPEPLDLAFCRFVLLHVHSPVVVLRRMRAAVRAGGWVVAQEPVTTAGRIGGRPLSMPDARHPDVGRPSAGPGGRGRPGAGGRLGRGAGVVRPGPGRGLPGSHDRRFPGGRPRAVAAARHRRVPADRALITGAGKSGGRPPGPDR